MDVQKNYTNQNSSSNNVPDDEVEEKPGYAFYCDKCDHIELKRSDWKRHKLVHEAPPNVSYHMPSKDVSTRPDANERAGRAQTPTRHVSNPQENGSPVQMRKDNLVHGITTQPKSKLSGPTARKKTSGVFRSFTKDDQSVNIHQAVIPNPHEPKVKQKRELKEGEGIMKPFKVSEDMAAIIGQKPGGITRPHCLKELWAYLKKNNLQDPNGKQYFTPDAKMAKIFGTEKMRAFSMSKYLTEHLLPLDEADSKGETQNNSNTNSTALNTTKTLANSTKTDVEHSFKDNNESNDRSSQSTESGESESKKIKAAEDDVDDSQETSNNDGAEEQSLSEAELIEEDDEDIIESDDQSNKKANDNVEDGDDYSGMETMLDLPLF